MGLEYNYLSTPLPRYTIWSGTFWVQNTITSVHDHLGTQSGLELFQPKKFLSLIFFFFEFIIFFLFSQFFCKSLTSSFSGGKLKKVAKIEVLEYFFAAMSSNIQKIVKNSNLSCLYQGLPTTKNSVAIKNLSKANNVL